MFSLVSAVGPLEHHLQLPNGGTADVEHGPARGQEDRGQHEQEPSVHGLEMSVRRSYGLEAGRGRRWGQLIDFAAIRAASERFAVVQLSRKPGSAERPAWAIASWR